MSVNNDPNNLYPKVHDYGFEISPNSTISTSSVGEGDAKYYAKNPTPTGVTFDEFMRNPKEHIGVDHGASIRPNLEAAKRDLAFARNSDHTTGGRIEAFLGSINNVIEAAIHWFKS